MRTTGRHNGGKWAWTAILVGLNLTLWILPSRVPYLIAQNRDVLLGRYSVERVTALLILGPISAVSLLLTWSDPAKKRRREFKVWAVSLAMVVAVVLVDAVARLTPHGYIVQQSYLHRAPNQTNRGTYRDVPEKAFMYRRSPAAYPDIEYTLSTDARGFRNREALDRCDVVVLGDSFAEGSNISDEQVWPVLLSRAGGLTVYNLGMSAGNCVSYAETLKRIGLGLSPTTVLCMMYEGNDLRDTNYRDRGSLRERVSVYIGSSPVRITLYRCMVRWFGSTEDRPQEAALPREADEPASAQDPANADGALGWLPVAVGPMESPRYYAFTVKRLLAHLVPADEFARTDGCRKTLEKIDEMKTVCDDHGIRFVLVYAPDKGRAVLPLVGSRVSAAQLHAFLSLGHTPLPPVGEIERALAERMDVQESAIAGYCRAHAIEFVSLVEPLRAAIAQGRQAYFTYDQHWTPIGHEIVAEVLAAYLGGADAEGPACDEGE